MYPHLRRPAKPDLPEVCDVSRAMIFATGHPGKAQRLRDFTVPVSEDGVSFTGGYGSL